MMDEDVADDDDDVIVVLLPSRVTIIVGGVCSMPDGAGVTNCVAVAGEDAGAACVTLAGAAVARVGAACVNFASATVLCEGVGVVVLSEGVAVVVVVSEGVAVVVVVSDGVAVVVAGGITGMRVTTTMGDSTAGLLCCVTVVTHPPDLGGPRLSGTDAADAFVGRSVLATDATTAAGDDDAGVDEGVDDDGVDEGVGDEVDGVDEGVDDAEAVGGALTIRVTDAACVTKPAEATLPAGGALTAGIRSGVEKSVGRVAAKEAAGGILSRCT